MSPKETALLTYCLPFLSSPGQCPCIQSSVNHACADSRFICLLGSECVRYVKQFAHFGAVGMQAVSDSRLGAITDLLHRASHSSSVLATPLHPHFLPVVILSMSGPLPHRCCSYIHGMDILATWRFVHMS